MDERANLLFYWFFKGRNSFKSRLPHKIPREILGGSFWFARHGRALTGESPEHAQIVGSV